MAALVRLCLLLASGGAAVSDTDGTSLLHLQLRDIPNSGRVQASDAPLLMDIMSMNGCRRFASLLAETPNATETFEQHFAAGGLTVFCPDDHAVAAFEPKFGNMSADAQLAVLLHHGAAGRYGREQIAAFDWVAVRTLATYPATNKSVTLTVGDDGDTVRLWASPGLATDPVTLTIGDDGDTVQLWALPPLSDGSYGAQEARVTKTIWSDESPLAVYVVDAVLLPSYLRQPVDGRYLRWLHYRIPVWEVIWAVVVKEVAGLGGRLTAYVMLR